MNESGVHLRPSPSTRRGGTRGGGVGEEESMLHVIPEALTYTWYTNVSDILTTTLPPGKSTTLGNS